MLRRPFDNIGKLAEPKPIEPLTPPATITAEGTLLEVQYPSMPAALQIVIEDGVDQMDFSADGTEARVTKSGEQIHHHLTHAFWWSERRVKMTKLAPKFKPSTEVRDVPDPALDS